MSHLSLPFLQAPRAALILSKARSGSGAQYPRVWMKSAIVERELGSDDKVRGQLGAICGGGEVAMCRAQTPMPVRGSVFS